MSEPYLITRIGPNGPDERGARYVLGPPLGPSYQELLAENRRLREELEELLQRLKARGGSG